MGALVRHGRSLGDGWPSSAAFSKKPLQTQHTGGISLKLGSSWRQLGASWSRLGVVLVLSWRPFSSSPARCAESWLLGPSFYHLHAIFDPFRPPCRGRSPKLCTPGGLAGNRGRLGASLGHLGAVLESSWCHLGALFPTLPPGVLSFGFLAPSSLIFTRSLALVGCFAQNPAHRGD